MSQSLFDLIELRSFSSLWYWVLVALTWARITQAPMGIPYDLAERARGSDQAASDLIAITGVQLRRYQAMAKRFGSFQIGLWAFVLSLLAGLSFAYGSELALAVLLLAAPLAFVQILSARTALGLSHAGPELDALLIHLRRLKRRVQATALVTVFFSAIIGMYHNLVHAAF